jgi:hypothetical protein
MADDLRPLAPAKRRGRVLRIDVSPGEWIDRLTFLEI